MELFRDYVDTRRLSTARVSVVLFLWNKLRKDRCRTMKEGEVVTDHDRDYALGKLVFVL